MKETLAAFIDVYGDDWRRELVLAAEDTTPEIQQLRRTEWAALEILALALENQFEQPPGGFA